MHDVRVNLGVYFLISVSVHSIPPEMFDFWSQSVTALKPLTIVPPPNKLFGLEINAYLVRATVHTKQVSHRVCRR